MNEAQKQVAGQFGEVTTDARGRISFEFDNHGLHAYASAIRKEALEEVAKVCDAHAKEVWGFTPALGKRIVYYEYPSRGGVYFWDGEKLSLQE